MVMGLINYPELGGSIDKIEEELDYYSRYASTEISCKRLHH